jgi:uncharacterized protein
VPRFAGWSLTAAEAARAGPLEVAVVGADDDVGRATLEQAARAATSPAMVVAVGTPGGSDVPLLAERPLVDGRAAAYVCRQLVCARPVTTVEELRAQLG